MEFALLTKTRIVNGRKIVALVRINGRNVTTAIMRHPFNVRNPNIIKSRQRTVSRLVVTLKI